MSAWLIIFAAGNLVLAADAGLHAWSLNRFLAFKSRNDCDRRTSRYYGAVFQLFVWFTAILAIVLLTVFGLFAPSSVLGFSTETGFDLAFAVMTLGMVFILPVNLASSLYRARGLYGRIVKAQAWGMAIGQLGQIIGVMATGSLLVVVMAFVAGQFATSIYILAVDVRRQFPFLGDFRQRISWRWVVGQFGGAFPFSITNFAEVGLTYLSVLLIGVFVSDRVAIAQWGLTRTIAALLRMGCIQMTLPLAAELGHDHAIGARDSLQRLYAKGSVVLTLFASAITSGALVFWPDFFAIWTHGAIPYDGTLAADPADRDVHRGAGHSGAQLCQLQQSRHPSAADQVAAAGDFSAFVDHPDPAPGSPGDSHRVGIERPDGPVRSAVLHSCARP